MIVEYLKWIGYLLIFIYRDENKFAMSVYLGNVQTERDIVYYSGSKSGASFVYWYLQKYYQY